MKSVWIGDTHFPFSNFKALKNIISFCSREQPDIIGQIGDLYDEYAFSRFAHSTNDMTPQKEIRLSRKYAEHLWESLSSACPKAKLIQKLGNHDARILKQVKERIPNLLLKVEINKNFENLLNINKLFTFDNVKTDYDYTNELFIKDGNQSYLVNHGWTKPGEHIRYYNQNCVVGHNHIGGTWFMKRINRVIWEANCGFLGNFNSKAFRYGETKMKNWTAGFIYIDNLGPRFICV